MRPKALLAVAAFILFVAACGTSKYDNDPLYDAGFSDGCSTGTSRSPGTPASKATRDDALWEQSDAYRAGWKAGYQSCSPGARGDIPGADRDIGGR
jgi:hypothetical protein